MANDMKFFTDGDAYERLMGRWSRLVGEKFIDWIKPLDGQHVLDVGCGNGAFTDTLLRRVNPTKVDAIDPSEDQIKYAIAHIERDNLQFHVGDAQSLPFDNDHFDAALMALVVAFLPDPTRAVAEMSRVVRTGGTVATYMWEALADDSVPLAPLSKAANMFGVKEVLTPSANVTTRDGLRNLWEIAGLAEIETTRIDIKVTFDSFDDFWDSCTALPNPAAQAIRTLSPTKLDEARSWLNQNLSRDAAGNICYGAFANAVKGQVK